MSRPSRGSLRDEAIDTQVRACGHWICGGLYEKARACARAAAAQALAQLVTA